MKMIIPRLIRGLSICVKVYKTNLKNENNFNIRFYIKSSIISIGKECDVNYIVVYKSSHFRIFDVFSALNLD